jgi:murein DD-endopeptidase MepM/ murein hydrolase activator NlpD
VKLLQQTAIGKSSLSRGTSIVLMAFSLMGLTAFFASGALAADYAYAPVAGSLTSPFGWRTDPFNGNARFHGGIDIAAAEGSPVYTPDAGTVVFSGSYGGYGSVVVIQHPGNLFTVYGHNSYLMATYGQKVKAGQMIALVGSTGRSTGPHLHFEVRQGNAYVNPLDYLNYLSQIGHYPLSTPAPQSALSAGHSHKAVKTIHTGATVSGTHTAHVARSTKPKARRHPNFSVEVIKGDNVEMVEF